MRVPGRSLADDVVWSHVHSRLNRLNGVQSGMLLCLVVLVEVIVQNGMVLPRIVHPLAWIVHAILPIVLVEWYCIGPSECWAGPP